MSAYVSGELREAIERSPWPAISKACPEVLAHQIEGAGGDRLAGPFRHSGGWRNAGRCSAPTAWCAAIPDVSRPELSQVENQGDRPEVRRALESGRAAAAPLSPTGHHPLLYVAAPVKGVAVRVVRLTQSLVPVQNAMARAERLMWLGALVALGVAALLAAAWSRIVSQSIRQLKSSAVAMLDDLSVRTRVRQSYEVGALAEALDQLADNHNRNVEKLGSERDRLAGILETMAEGVLLTNRSGRIVLANGSLRMMVASSGQLVCKEPIEAIRNNELAEMIESVQRTESPATGEVELIGILPRRVLVRAAPLTVSGDEGVVVVLSDVTELRGSRPAARP
jgi:PAS domain-containing protein